MRDRSPRSAVAALLRPLREASSCVTRHRLIATRNPFEADRGRISFVSERAALVRTEHNHPAVALRVLIDYAVIDDQAVHDRYRTIITAYNYAILDPHDRELIVFHWHPNSVSLVRHPHLHLTSRVRPFHIEDPHNPARMTGQINLAGMHIATGPVPFADVMRLLIEEFRVVPLRPDWDNILKRTTPSLQP